jgi:hypothetical protein
MKFLNFTIIAALFFCGGPINRAATDQKDVIIAPKWKGLMLFGSNNTKSLFFLSNVDDSKFQWIKAGDTFEGFRVVGVDQKNERLNLMSPAGLPLQIPLEESKILSVKKTAMPREEAKKMLLEMARGPRVKAKNPQPFDLNLLPPEIKSRLDPLPPPQLDITTLGVTERKVFEDYLANEEGTKITSASEEGGKTTVIYRRALRREAMPIDVSANLTDEDIREISDALWK